MRRTTIQQQAERLAERKKQLGILSANFVPPNEGGRRTASKAALLRKLKEVAEKRGRAPTFKANI